MPIAKISNNLIKLIEASETCPTGYRAYKYNGKQLCLSNDVSIDTLPTPDTITITNAEHKRDSFTLSNAPLIGVVDQWNITYDTN